MRTARTSRQYGTGNNREAFRIKLHAKNIQKKTGLIQTIDTIWRNIEFKKVGSITYNFFAN